MNTVTGTATVSLQSEPASSLQNMSIQSASVMPQSKLWFCTHPRTMLHKWRQDRGAASENTLVGLDT